MMTVSTKMPLEGLRILDLATMLAGPLASTLLADFGAEVVKVELPDRGDPERDLPPHRDGIPLWWKVTNRNKNFITLDIRKPAGRDLLLELIGDFDVLVENFRPGTLERYGLGPDVLHEHNPKLTILRVTGYGQTGPMAHQPGFARVAEAYSGFTYLCGLAETEPMHLGFPVADANAGVFGAMSIMIAAFARMQRPDSPGEVIDLSLVESMFRVLEFLPVEYDQLGKVRERSGNRSQYAGPSNIYPTSDGNWISMSASSQSVFERLANLIGRNDLIADDRFATNADRVVHADELDVIIRDWFLQRTRDEALADMVEAQVPGGPVNSIKDIFENPHFRAREAVQQVPDDDFGTVAMSAAFPKFREQPGAVRHAARARGTDTEQFLRACGVTIERIRELKETDVI